jgi:hypothetical protein
MKKKIISFRVLSLSVLMALMGTGTALSQVTIGVDDTPDANVLLDLKETTSGTSTKGFLPPRVALQAVNLVNPLTNGTGVAEGTIVYNTATSADQSSDLAVSPGLYYWGGVYEPSTKKGGWIKFQTSATSGWFYMPSIVIDVTTSGTFTRDLYLEYQKQFEDTENSIVSPESLTAGNALVKSEAGAPSPFTKVYASSELYYYIIGYDATVFSNVTVSSAGLLSYTINANNVTDATFMNIVFKVK